MEEIDVNVVTIDNIEYTEISRLEDNGETFIFLSNLDNPEDFCIKKVVKENNEEFIEPLKSEEQFNKLSRLFLEKLKEANK